MSETNPKFPKRHFLGWNQPLCATISQWLWQQMPDRIADFSKWQIFVPTAESGRILRRALIELIPEGQNAFLSPVIQTPAQFFQSALSGEPLLSPLEQELSWAKIIKTAPSPIIETLFKRSPENESEGRNWARNCAKEIIKIRSKLVEADKNFQSISQLAEVDKNRWTLLSKLEAAYLDFISAFGKLDPHDGWRTVFLKQRKFKSIQNWVLAGIPDPIPLLLQGIQQNADILKKSVVLIGAPQSEEANFDSWGRPITAHWSTAEIPDLLLTENRVTTRDADETILVLDKIIYQSESPEQHWTVGCSDATLEKDILHWGESRNIATHQPKGLPLSNGEWPALIKAWRQWQLNDSVSQLTKLLSFPAIIRGYFPDSINRRITLRKGLDNFIQKHLPSTLNQLLSIPKPEQTWIPQLVRQIDNDRKKISEGNDFSTNFHEWIQKLIGQRNLSRKVDLMEITALEMILNWLNEWDSSILVESTHIDDALVHLEEVLHKGVCYPPKTEPSIDISGWLELLWDPKPNLLFTHFNEGIVPEAVVGDAYLPESLRQKIGLGSNDERLARDAYIFRLILEQRRQSGSTHWIIGKQDNEGNALKPSRLLFLCKDEQLPNRVLESIHPAGEPLKLPSKSRLWQLDPGLIELPEKSSISVTEFKQYLACPFRYFLRYRLKMEPHEDSNGELDARAFGNLAHEVLFQLQSNLEYAEITDKRKLDLASAHCLDSCIKQLYGSDLSLPILLQRENLLSRLIAANEQIIQSRLAGWKTVFAEWQFHKEESEAKIAGWTLRGIIDLIERNEDTGAYRITDYKTSEKPVTPEKAHLHKVTRQSKADTEPKIYSDFHYKGKLHRWQDLQLPLYAWVLREKLGVDSQICYFQLPRALNEAGRVSWDNFDNEALDSALQCANEIVKNIQSNIYWPPGKAQGTGGIEEWLNPEFESWISPEWIKMAKERNS